MIALKDAYELLGGDNTYEQWEMLMKNGYKDCELLCSFEEYVDSFLTYTIEMRGMLG